MEGVIVLMSSQIIIKIIGLIYKLYLTNKQGFGDKGNAIYGSAFQIYALFLTVSSIGVPNAISKLVSSKLAIGDNKGAYRIFKIAIALFGVCGFIGSSILFFGAEYIANTYLLIPEAKLAILSLSPSVFLVSITSVLRGYFNGKENLSVTAHSQNIEQIFKTLFTILIVEKISDISRDNTVLMAAAASISTTLATFSSLIYLYRYFKKRKKNVWQEVISSSNKKKESVNKIIKSILIVSVPMAIGGLFAMLGKLIDAFTITRILKNVVGEELATIQYGILNGKVDTLITLPYSFNIAIATALVPTISYAIARNQNEIAKRRIEFSILVTILIGLPCTIYMSVFSEQILELLFPNASTGAQMLQLASWSIIFVVLIQTINGALQGLGKVNITVVAYIVSAVIKLILNLILIPIRTIGINGAIISAIISHIITLIICFNALKRSIKLNLRINKFLIKPLISSTLMGAVSWIIYTMLGKNVEQNKLLLITLLIGFMTYIILTILLKNLSKEEIFMLPYGQKLYKKYKGRYKDKTT